MRSALHMSSPAFSSRKLAAMVSWRSQARNASSTDWRSKPIASRRPTAACSSSFRFTATEPGGTPAQHAARLSCTELKSAAVAGKARLQHKLPTGACRLQAALPLRFICTAPGGTSMRQAAQVAVPFLNSHIYDKLG